MYPNPSPLTRSLSSEGALVIFSGGQDSTTCLYWALRHFGHVEAITYSYGQSHADEVQIARTLALEAGVQLRVMELPFIAELGKSALTDPSIPMDDERPEEGPGVPNTFVPGRNLFFISIAAVYAQQRGLRHLVTGVSQTDFSGYPDCRDAFVRSLNVSVDLALDDQVVIHTPLMWLDKAQTWALADELSVLEIVRDRTLTCYRGIVGSGCGHCPACTLRQRGLDTYMAQRHELSDSDGHDQ